MEGKQNKSKREELRVNLTGQEKSSTRKQTAAPVAVPVRMLRHSTNHFLIMIYKYSRSTVTAHICMTIIQLDRL